MNVFIKKTVDGSRIKTLFTRNGKYYIASNNGKETIVFPANKDGEITSYNEIIEGWACIDDTSELFSGAY